MAPFTSKAAGAFTTAPKRSLLAALAHACCGSVAAVATGGGFGGPTPAVGSVQWLLEVAPTPSLPLSSPPSVLLLSHARHQARISVLVSWARLFFFFFNSARAYPFCLAMEAEVFL